MSGSATGRRISVRRFVKVLVLLDILVVGAALVVWIALRDDPASNAVNAGLRGSAPPSGQVWPSLSRLDGVKPAFPTRSAVRGRATMLVATCTDCPSGEILGGFLGRLGPDGLPSDAKVVVLTWGGDQAAWVDRWKLDDVPSLQLHEAIDPRAALEARRTLGIGSVADGEESGVVRLHDGRGRWRSSYFLGQLQRDDIAFDLERLGGD